MLGRVDARRPLEIFVAELEMIVTDSPPLAAQLLENVTRSFQAQKELAERALAQLDDRDLARTIDRQNNSIAVIVKHLRGNMRSRWTDFLTTDGEKPDRRRETEFELDALVTRSLLLEWWDDGWGVLFSTLGSLRPSDLQRTVRIGGEPYTVVEALHRQLTHYAYHVGQIVLLAKHFRGEKWETLA